MNLNYRSFADMSALVQASLRDFPKVDVVVGIPRSGMVPAAQIALLTHQPLASLHEILMKSWVPSRHGGRWRDPIDIKHILLVDDSVNGGETMVLVKKQLLLVYPELKIETCAAYVDPAQKENIDHPLEICDAHAFQWNWYRTRVVRQAMLDIDGVVCHDPEFKDLDEEGNPSKEFCLNAQPLYIPRKPVIAFATGRRESKRAETEQWLAKYGIRYKKLFMSQPGQGAKHTKMLAFCEMKPSWIVESNSRQAEWLRAHARVPVLCTDTAAIL